MGALGLRDLRKGFATTEALDRAFALGWPEVRRVGDAAGIPTEIAGLRFVWTDEDARVRLRASFERARLPIEDATFGARTALAFARHVIHSGWAGTFDDLETDVFLLEALAGPPVLAHAMTSALEEISPNEWRRSDRASYLPFYLLGFVLLRTEEEAALEIRARLEKLYEKRRDDGGPLVAAIDLVLHRAEGARRSACRRSERAGGDAELDPSMVLLVSDPELIAAVVSAERFAKHDRRFAARLAFLGGDRVLEAVAQRWSSVGDAKSRAFFVETAGRIGAVAASIAAQEEAAAAVPAPRAAREGTRVSFEVDEFGYVLLPEESAVLLRGDDDHTLLTVDLDPISLEPAFATSHGRGAVVFCRTYDASYAETDDGLLFTYAVDGDQADGVFLGAAARRFTKLGELDVTTKLVGLPASISHSEASEDERIVTLPAPPGRYIVWTASQKPDDDDGDEPPPLLWFQRAP